jgi:hypothetical protein
MFAPLPKISKNNIKLIEYKQDSKTYKFEIYSNSDTISFNVKDLSKIDFFYELEISFAEIQKKNNVFRIYQSEEEFINALEGIIKNKNISIEEEKDNLIFNVFFYNILNGNKENVSFTLLKKVNSNKDEIIKHLYNKVNDLEEKINEMNKNYLNLKEFVNKSLLAINNPNFAFVWQNHSNCELFDGGKRIKKVKNKGWNTGVKGNNLLKRNEINVFKIKVNHINSDKSGLHFGISKSYSSIGCGTDWNISCDSTSNYKYRNFQNEKINEGDIITFIANLKIGTLEVKKNNNSLGMLKDLPTNEDLVPSVSIYYVDDEVEIID